MKNVTFMHIRWSWQMNQTIMKVKSTGFTTSRLNRVHELKYLSHE